MTYSKFIDDLLDLSLKHLDPRNAKELKSKDLKPPEPQVGLTSSAPNFHFNLQHNSFSESQPNLKYRSQSNLKSHSQFNSQSNSQSNSKHLLQVDHRMPFAFWGANTEENLAILCAAHNQLRARQIFN